jgi:sugar phosphate isomerase/epimerase
MLDGIAAGGMPCDSLHGVFGEEFDPSAPDEPRRRSAVETYRREGELCRKLGGKLVVVHCASIRREGVSRAEHDRRIDQLKKSVEQLGRFGAERGILYAFENLPGYHAIGYDVRELAAVLRDVGAPNTGMCFDSGHANMVCDAAEAVKQTAGQMIYAHISDNDGREDQHEMITRGTIDADALARALREVGYDGTFMLEVFYPADRLRRLLSEGIAERLSGLLQAAAGEPAEEGRAASG